MFNQSLSLQCPYYDFCYRIVRFYVYWRLFLFHFCVSVSKTLFLDPDVHTFLQISHNKIVYKIDQLFMASFRIVLLQCLVGLFKWNDYDRFKFGFEHTPETKQKQKFNKIRKWKIYINSMKFYHTKNLVQESFNSVSLVMWCQFRFPAMHWTWCT